MRFRALPQLHNENRVGFVVTDTHLVRQATDLLESGVARGEVRDSSSRLPGTAPNVPTFAKVMLGTLGHRIDNSASARKRIRLRAIKPKALHHRLVRRRSC